MLAAGARSARDERAARQQRDRSLAAGTPADGGAVRRRQEVHRRRRLAPGRAHRLLELLLDLPLLLAFASILGFLLDGNPDFQKDVLDSTVAQFP
jgi:hypothetical protein